MERVLSRSREVKVEKYDGSSDVEKYDGSLDIVLTVLVLICLLAEPLKRPSETLLSTEDPDTSDSLTEFEDWETHGRFLLGNNVSHGELARFEAGVTMEITRVEAWYSGSDGSLGNTATYILRGLSRSLILRCMQVSVFLMESGNAHESHDELIELVASSKLRSFTCLVKTNCRDMMVCTWNLKAMYRPLDFPCTLHILLRIETVFKKDAKKGVFKNELERVNLMRGPILAVS
nr:nuclear pore complex protein NUP107 [Tanacetum cinerariifolium]